MRGEGRKVARVDLCSAFLTMWGLLLQRNSHFSSDPPTLFVFHNKSRVILGAVFPPTRAKLQRPRPVMMFVQTPETISLGQSPGNGTDGSCARLRARSRVCALQGPLSLIMEPTGSPLI